MIDGKLVEELSNKFYKNEYYKNVLESKLKELKKDIDGVSNVKVTKSKTTDSIYAEIKFKEENIDKYIINLRNHRTNLNKKNTNSFFVYKYQELSDMYTDIYNKVVKYYKLNLNAKGYGNRDFGEIKQFKMINGHTRINLNTYSKKQRAMIAELVKEKYVEDENNIAFSAVKKIGLINQMESEYNRELKELSEKYNTIMSEILDTKEPRMTDSDIEQANKIAVFKTDKFKLSNLPSATKISQPNIIISDVDKYIMERLPIYLSEDIRYYMKNNKEFLTNVALADFEDKPLNQQLEYILISILAKARNKIRNKRKRYKRYHNIHSDEFLYEIDLLNVYLIDTTITFLNTLTPYFLDNLEEVIKIFVTIVNDTTLKDITFINYDAYDTFKIAKLLAYNYPKTYQEVMRDYLIDKYPSIMEKLEFKYIEEI